MIAKKLVLCALVLGGVSLLFSRYEERLPSGVQVIPLEGAVGPESLAFDGHGAGPYTGVSNGQILKWNAHNDRWIRYAIPRTHLFNECSDTQGTSMEHVCGRPLGLQFNTKTGELFVADAYLGLLMVRPNETISIQLVSHAQGQPFRFVNSLDIDHDSGVVYFTDSSRNFQRREFMSAIISGDKTGRAMQYDPRTKQVEVLLDDLSFPNGVALSKDGTFLLIAETSTCRILRYWLRPSPKAGSLEVLLELPGFPDNIKRSPRGGFWVAMHSKRSRPLKWALSHPWISGILLRLLHPNLKSVMDLFIDSFRGKALAVRFGEEGEVLEVLEGFGGRKLRFISEVEERNGSLWVGSVKMSFVGVYKLMESDYALES